VIDSHCHLDFPKLKNNFINIIENSKKNNLTTILTINTDPKKFKDHIALIENYNNIYISYGLHPDYINNKTIFSIDKIISFCNHPKVIGIGETGMDFYHSSKFITKQKEIFENHIISSIQTKLPLIIHQRNSENEIMDVLQNYKDKNLSVVFHCFTGSKKLLKFCIDNNYYISLSGIVTF
jgi:Mg-dependent DNase